MKSTAFISSLIGTFLLSSCNPYFEKVQQQALKGNVTKQLELSNIYAAGGTKEVPSPDPVKAKYWLEKAASQSDSAKETLIDNYLNGNNGFPKDLVTAEKHYDQLLGRLIRKNKSATDRYHKFSSQDKSSSSRLKRADDSLPSKIRRSDLSLLESALDIAYERKRFLNNWQNAASEATSTAGALERLTSKYKNAPFYSPHECGSIATATIHGINESKRSVNDFINNLESIKESYRNQQMQQAINNAFNNNNNYPNQPSYQPRGYIIKGAQ